MYLLLIRCPGGYERHCLYPKVLISEHSEKTYYIRKLSSTVEALELDIKELISLTNNIPFDDRINPKAIINDLNLSLISRHLYKTKSPLFKDINNRSIKDIAFDLRIANGPTEYFKPLNVGLLFFNLDPEQFFPYCRIELVNIPDPTGQGMEERIFKGPINQQLEEALLYIRNNVIAEKNI